MLGWLLACVPEPETERVEVRPGEELGDSAPEDADDTAAAAWPPFIEWTSPTEGEHVSEIVRVDIATSPASDRAIDEVTEMSLRVDGTEVVHRYNSGIEATIEACPEAEPYQLALAVVATTAGGATTERERTVTRDFETILDLSIARSRIEGPDREANARISTDETLVSVDWRLDGELVASDVPAQVDSSKCDPCTGACWDASATLDLRAYRSRVTVACTITTASGDQVIDEEMLEFNRDADYDGRDGREWGEDDCDDGDSSVYGGAPELCDGKDNDCDDDIDESCSDEPSWPGTWTVATSASAVITTPAESELGMPTLAADYNGDGYTDLVLGAPYYDGYPNWWGAVYFVPGPLADVTDVDGTTGVIVRGPDAEWQVGEYLAAGDDYDGDGCDDSFLARCDRYDGCWFSGASVATGVATDVGHLVSLADDELQTARPGSAGDMSGDGYDDLVLLTYVAGSSTNEDGRISMIAGPFLDDVATSDATAVVSGTADFRVGRHAWAGGSDLDGDGQNDLVIPASSGAVDTDEIDAVLILSGPLAGGTATEADAVLELAPETSADLSVKMLGDIDGDGTVDLALGLPNADDAGPLSGKVLLELGPVANGVSAGWSDLVAVGEGTVDSAGWDVSAIETSGAPGILLVGAPGGNGTAPYSGVVYGIAMPASGTIDLADVTERWAGDSWNHNFGAGLVAGHDLDGDGLLDLVIGDPAYVAYGGVFIFPEP